MILEKLLIPQEDIIKYENLPDNEKLLFLYNLLKNHPNKNNLKSARDVYAGSISENGFDDKENPFIKFMNNTKHDFNTDQASLIRELIENKSLTPNEVWLYKPTLWDEGNEETLFKIKALTYAGNEDLQSNANKQITPESLMDNRGRIYSASTIKRLLNDITVKKESLYTIKNVLERFIKNSTFIPKTIDYLKTKIKEANLDANKEIDYLNMLKDKNKFNLFLNIPVEQPTESKLIKALKELNLEDFYDSQNVYGKEKSNNRNKKGVEILQNHLNDPQITWTEFTNYLRDTFKENQEINQFLRNSSNIKQIRDNLVKILNSNIDVVFDEDPIDVLNTKLEQSIISFIDKQNKDTTKQNKNILESNLNNNQKDALETLINLGIKKSEAYNLVNRQPGTAEQIIERVIRGN